MIKHSPAENYLKYLLSHPGCYDDLYIKDVARELGLDVLGDWYLQWLRQRVKPPTPFYPEENHKASNAFMQREQLTYAFLPDTAMNQAMRILQRPRARETLETMVLSGAGDEPTALAIVRRHKMLCLPLAVARYRHYFWNIELLDSTQMRALLDFRNSDVLEHPDKAIKNQFASLNRMRHADPRVIAARLPQSPVTGLIAQMSAGVMPKRMDVVSVLDTAWSQCVVRVAQHTGNGSPNDALMAAQYANTAEAITRLKATLGNPEEQLRNDLNRISVATTPHQVPTIRQLSDGKHTTNLQPEPKEEESSNGSDDKSV
jgi:hypothetical protein